MENRRKKEPKCQNKKSVCKGIEVIRTELSLPARNEEARDAIRGQSKGQIEEWFTACILSIN